MVSEIDQIDGIRILIVDDEPDILESLEELLPMCELVKAHNFEEAKKHFETDHFDLCILDIMGVDGYRLLEIANEKDIIAVMLTGHSLSVKARQSGGGRDMSAGRPAPGGSLHYWMISISLRSNIKASLGPTGGLPR